MMEFMQCDEFTEEEKRQLIQMLQEVIVKHMCLRTRMLHRTLCHASR